VIGRRRSGGEGSFGLQTAAVVECVDPRREENPGIIATATAARIGHVLSLRQENFSERIASLTAILPSLASLA